MAKKYVLLPLWSPVPQCGWLFWLHTTFSVNGNTITGYNCRHKEAINECTAALEVSPGYHKALTRRAKAYEQMGHYKQALSDVQKANKGSDATPETQVSSAMTR